MSWNNSGSLGIGGGGWWLVLREGTTSLLDAAWPYVLLVWQVWEDHSLGWGWGRASRDGYSVAPRAWLSLFLFLFRDGHAGQRVHR